jgi:hypothetical protein
MIGQVGLDELRGALLVELEGLAEALLGPPRYASRELAMGIKAASA